ncbi:MAG: bifunctional hydroxymethylpyrimidine kinase/phosphomethylpyrimidine kinase [Terriglobia bacterium]
MPKLRLRAQGATNELMNHNTTTSSPVILTIAGFDPSGGAGILADLKTFAAHNCYGVAAITALTIQNSQGVAQVYPIETSKLRECLENLLADGHICAVKIGMLANAANATVVSEFLASNPELPVVLDPILRSTSGKELIDAAGTKVLRTELLKRATLITPNLAEAAVLTGLKVETVEEMKTAARRLHEMGAQSAIVTGGHHEKAVDVFFDGAHLEVFSGDRVKPENTHGTGCTFASAIVANLAHGRQMKEAIVLAKVFVTEAIRKAFPVGPGRVPLNHLYRMQQAPRPVADHAPAVPEAVH